MHKRSVYAKHLVLILGLFFACFAPAIAQDMEDMEFIFSNELSTDILNISVDGITLGSIENEVIAEIVSRQFDFGVDALINIDLSGFSYSVEDFDWYAAFRPVSFLEIGFSKDYYLTGSYLYVEDENIAGSKMGSDGLSLVFLGDGVGVPGLKIGATVPLTLDGEINPFSGEFNFGVGAEYTYNDIVTLGVAAQNPISNDDRVLSVGAAVFPIEDLKIYAGYSFNNQEGLLGMYGTHLVNASVAYKFDRVIIGLDFITNLAIDTDSDYNIYAALYEEFRVSDPIIIFLTLSEYNTLGEDEIGWLFTVKPGVELNTAFGAFSFEVEASFDNGGVNVCFPISWMYEF